MSWGDSVEVHGSGKYVEFQLSVLSETCLVDVGWDSHGGRQCIAQAIWHAGQDFFIVA